MLKNEFKVYRGTITVTSNNLGECIDYINSNKIKSVYICQFYYQDNNLNFLEKCPEVSEININNSQINNIDALYSQNNLKSLILQDISCNVDMSRFDGLESFSGTWNKNYENLDKQNKIKHLNLSNYNPKLKNLSELVKFSELETLELVNSTIQTLAGIERLINLNSLKLYFLKNLTSIKDLEYSNNIKELMIEGCKKIEDYNSLEKVRKLSKITILNCGCIENIRFVDSLEEIDYFVCLKTKIKEDSFLPQKRIEYFDVE